MFNETNNSKFLSITGNFSPKKFPKIFSILLTMYSSKSNCKKTSMHQFLAMK